MKRNLWVVWIAVVVFVTAVKVCWAEEGLRDIKDPVLLSGTPWGIYIALAFFVTALTVGLFWRQKRKAQKEARPELPYWAKALKNLSQLEKGELRSQVLIPQLFTELSDIIRQYMERRFSIKASEMTTEEFLLHLRNSDKLTSQHKQILKDFLSSCDLVKFAKHVPGDSEIQDGINAARDLIQQTKPAESS